MNKNWGYWVLIISVLVELLIIAITIVKKRKNVDVESESQVFKIADKDTFLLMEYMLEALGFTYLQALAYTEKGCSLSNPNKLKSRPLYELEIVTTYLENYYEGMIIYHIIESKVDNVPTYSFCYACREAYESYWEQARCGVACVVEIKVKDIYNLNFDNAPYLKVNFAEINVEIDKNNNLQRIDNCGDIDLDIIDASLIKHSIRNRQNYDIIL